MFVSRVHGVRRVRVIVVYFLRQGGARYLMEDLLGFEQVCVGVFRWRGHTTMSKGH
jgi:hypothetical protein